MSRWALQLLAVALPLAVAFAPVKPKKFLRIADFATPAPGGGAGVTLSGFSAPRVGSDDSGGSAAVVFNGCPVGPGGSCECAALYVALGSAAGSAFIVDRIASCQTRIPCPAPAPGRPACNPATREKFTQFGAAAGGARAVVFMGTGGTDHCSGGSSNTSSCDGIYVFYVGVPPTALLEARPYLKYTVAFRTQEPHLEEEPHQTDTVTLSFSSFTGAFLAGSGRNDGAVVFRASFRVVQAAASGGTGMVPGGTGVGIFQAFFNKSSSNVSIALLAANGTAMAGPAPAGGGPNSFSGIFGNSPATTQSGLSAMWYASNGQRTTSGKIKNGIFEAKFAAAGEAPVLSVVVDNATPLPDTGIPPCIPSPSCSGCVGCIGCKPAGCPSPGPPPPWKFSSFAAIAMDPLFPDIAFNAELVNDVTPVLEGMFAVLSPRAGGGDRLKKGDEGEQAVEEEAAGNQTITLASGAQLTLITSNRSPIPQQTGQFFQYLQEASIAKRSVVFQGNNGAGKNGIYLWSSKTKQISMIVDAVSSHITCGDGKSHKVGTLQLNNGAFDGRFIAFFASFETADKTGVYVVDLTKTHADQL